MAPDLYSRTIINEVAKELARQDISPKTSRETVWRAQRDEVKVAYRQRAINVLSVVEEVLAIR